MRQRLYPETIPVLASSWLKTLCAMGHSRSWWKELSGLMRHAIREEPLNELSREALVAVENWLEAALATGGAPRAIPPGPQSLRPHLTPEVLPHYVARLLNEWLPSEIARLLVDESDLDDPSDAGIPVLAVGRAIERLLVRERLSPENLESFLQPEILNPRYIYPADAEVFRDIVISILGRTSAPPYPVLPATLVTVAPGSSLPANFADAILRRSFVKRSEDADPAIPYEKAEEIHVPIEAAQAQDIRRHAPLRIASLIATADGRCWESESLQSGAQHLVIFKPRERLRLDRTEEHARLKLPWPDARLKWTGTVHFPESLELFGRQWHGSSLEEDTQRAWLNLVFSHPLTLPDSPAAAEPHFRRSHPASVDMAWAALANALSASMEQKDGEPVEQLRRAEFVPLGRAILAVCESMKGWRLPKMETVLTHLNAIRFHHAGVASEYGRIPWGIVPGSFQQVFLKRRLEPAAVELLNQVFDGLPPVLCQENAAAHIGITRVAVPNHSVRDPAA
jgi:hypothetical protein